MPSIDHLRKAQPVRVSVEISLATIDDREEIFRRGDELLMMGATEDGAMSFAQDSRGRYVLIPSDDIVSIRYCSWMPDRLFAV
jgi:hypothetical protein